MLLKFEDHMWTSVSKQYGRKPVNSQGVISDQQEQNWFANFHSGQMPLENESKQKSSSDFDDVSLKSLMESNPEKSNWDLAKTQSTSQSTLYWHLEKIGKLSKLGVLVLNALSKKNEVDHW